MLSNLALPIGRSVENLRIDVCGRLPCSLPEDDASVDTERGGEKGPIML